MEQGVLRGMIADYEAMQGIVEYEELAMAAETIANSEWGEEKGTGRKRGITEGGKGASL